MTPDSSAAVDHLREVLSDRRTVYQGRLLSVYEDRVVLPDGREAGREVVHHRGAVGVVPVLADGRVVLVRQWRHAVEGAIWEIPAGTRDDRGEDPAGTAARELREETGYAAERWTPLGEVCVSPGYSRELLTFFLAEGLVEGETDTDDDEQLDVAPHTAEEIAELVRTGQTDAKTVAGLALAGLLPAVTRR